MGMDEVIRELTYRFQGRDNNIVCALGETYLSENATVEQFDVIANYYNLIIGFLNNFLLIIQI